MSVVPGAGSPGLSELPRPPLVVALFGPTGTGKTELACALADRLPAHLVSCDAVQVYRGLEAASAKPTGIERRHPWQLVDWVEPHVDVNLGAWVRAAERELARAAAARHVPIVAGGTGLYLRGLLKGVAPAPPRSPAQRRRLEALEASRGPGFLHRVLSRLDPPLAARLSPADTKRLVRGLEVRLETGSPLSALQDEGWRGPDRFRALRVGLTIAREELYERLDRRVERFFEAGLVEEVRALVEESGVPYEANALKGIGYREVLGWYREGGDPARLGALVEEVQRSTRRYAKRQLTWFRSEPDTIWVDPREEGLADALAAFIVERAASCGGGSEVEAWKRARGLYNDAHE